jgi:hypothetical protein
MHVATIACTGKDKSQAYAAPQQFRNDVCVPLKALVPQGQLLGLQIGENADTLLANS